jgi:fucose 4-O-acetylase-like acetyltransferase
MKVMYGLLVSLLLGLGIGFFDWTSSYLSLTRTFVFFPLFLTGYYMKKEYFEIISRNSAKIFAITTFVFAFIGFYYFPNINYQWLFGSKSYSALGEDSLQGLIIRLFFYFLSSLMIYCFFACVPKRQYFFTRFGKNTLYVYLLHGFIVRIFRVSSLQEIFNTPKSYFLIVVLSFLLTMILSTRIVTSLAQPFIELKWTKMRKLRSELSEEYANLRKST